MTGTGPESSSLSELPCREQLARIRRLEIHLKALLRRYDCEPRTLDHFLRRETLMERLQTLEANLSRISDQLRGKAGSPRGMSADLARLKRELRELEAGVRAYAES